MTYDLQLTTYNQRLTTNDSLPNFGSLTSEKSLATYDKGIRMMKKAFYSEHLKLRLRLRKIPYRLPTEIYQTAKEHYFDKETLNYAAAKKVLFKGKLREMIVVYERENNRVMLITIHPLKMYQKIVRIRSKRWEKI